MWSPWISETYLCALNGQNQNQNHQSEMQLELCQRSSVQHGVLTESWLSAEGRRVLCWWSAACCRTARAGWGFAGLGRCWLSNSLFCWHSAAWNTKRSRSAFLIYLYFLLLTLLYYRHKQKINTNADNLENLFFPHANPLPLSTALFISLFPTLSFAIASSFLSTRSWLYFFWPWPINLKIAFLYIFTFSSVAGGEYPLLGWVV